MNEVSDIQKNHKYWVFRVVEVMKKLEIPRNNGILNTMQVTARRVVQETDDRA